jgi:hypothetical protein
LAALCLSKREKKEDTLVVNTVRLYDWGGKKIEERKERVKKERESKNKTGSCLCSIYQ